MFLFGPRVIRSLRVRQGKGQPIRKDGPERHLLQKQGTPTMGGLMILSGVTVAVLLWGNLANPYVWVVLLLTLVYGAVGLYDDYLKVTRQTVEGSRGTHPDHHRGCRRGCRRCRHRASGPGPARHLARHSVLQGHPDRSRLVVYSVRRLHHRRRRQCREPDRRARWPRHRAGHDRRATFGFIAYLVGNALFADYLQIHFVQGTGELAVICGALVGAGLGFLWFNAPPAQIFMGDTGSLALGGALGTIAVATKHELVLAIVGGLFVLEAASVIVQVASSSCSASASSVWRRCTIISSRRDGPNPRW